jgi:hypothetical protein
MRLFLNVVFAAAACVQCAVVSAQVPSQRIILRLGMTGAEVRKAFGTPQIYRQSKPARDFPSSAAGVMPPSHDYHDVYEIKTSLNAYDLEVQYAMDDSESRLHPVPRITSIYFELDKRMGINDVSKILDDIPEVAALCGAECTIAENPIMAGYFDLRLHPKAVLPTEQAEADWVGSIFGRYPASRFKPTVILFFERGLITRLTVVKQEEGLIPEGPVKATWKPQRP